jgi:hypothetical protein
MTISSNGIESQTQPGKNVGDAVQSSCSAGDWDYSIPSEDIRFHQMQNFRVSSAHDNRLLPSYQ